MLWISGVIKVAIKVIYCEYESEGNNYVIVPNYAWEGVQIKTNLSSIYNYILKPGEETGNKSI